LRCARIASAPTNAKYARPVTHDFSRAELLAITNAVPLARVPPISAYDAETLALDGLMYATVAANIPARASAMWLRSINVICLVYTTARF
jgi:hypothetical protein